MREWLREPLLHFLLLGAGLFLAYQLKPGTDPCDAPRRIIVTQGQIEHLAAGFTRTWQRPPTPTELAGLVQDRVQEEIYCREAIALGLDRDDTVIRRRLRQKMEFVSDDLAAQVEPGDPELDAYLRAHPERFRIPPRLTFRHVFLNPKERGDRLGRDATQMLAELCQSAGTTDTSLLGDPLQLEGGFTRVPIDEIARQFGGPFATELSQLPTGQWRGPIESGYGVHLVQIVERIPERLPALPEVREEVAREWAHARRRETSHQVYQEMLKRYTVTIETPAVTVQVLGGAEADATTVAAQQ